HYKLSDYTKEGFKQARQAATYIITKLLGATELTNLKPTPDKNPGFFIYDDEPYSFQGAGHLMGTYRMGDDRKTSVVDKHQRSWDHSNLFLVGDGVFPSSGTANPSLTIAALSFQAADVLANELKAATVTVQANRPWQGTGVQLNGVSPRLVRYAGGHWSASPAGGMVDGRGNPLYLAKPGYTLPGASEGALIGRVGADGEPFLICDLAEIPAGRQGELLLCINDDLDGRYGVGLQDNHGELAVPVGFCPL
ncbi:GMC family oxidoreductase, partial [Pseudomonas sp. MWU13-2625]